MSKGWRTKADVLKDLSEVNGRRTGAEHLDLHVVEGQRPPPIHHEAPDEDEMSYFSGGQRPCAEGRQFDPDLVGISTMLKLVKDMDDTVERNEPVTLYLNRSTDEIRISKLNPLAGEYVPGSSGQFIPAHSPKKANEASRDKVSPRKNKIMQHSIKLGIDKSVVPKFNANMFKSKSERSKEQVIGNEVENPPLVEKTDKTHADEEPSVPKTTSTENNNALKTCQIELGNTAESKPNLLPNGLPKRVIEKPENVHEPSKDNKDEVKEIQEKIKSTILASTTDNSLKAKRQKNVAIAALLKLGLNQATTPVKLIKPDYFEKPPTEAEKEEKPVENEIELNEVPSMSSSETNVNHVDIVDPDSISKVNGWFNNIERPKPKPQVKELLVVKDSITFKKKTISNVSAATSSNSISSKEAGPTQQKPKAFKPSSYANDLLKKYETNAQHTAPLIEDLGTRLERQLKERDELIRQKMARQNGGLSC